MVECPTCFEEFDSERGMKIHHTSTHGFDADAFEAEQEWVKLTRFTDCDESIETVMDRFARQVERRIICTAERFDLDAR